MRPDFDDLVGSDLGAEERSRLERVHELLIAAGPPPDPIASPMELKPRRRRGAALAIAAALAVSAFALGAALADEGSTSPAGYVVSMRATESAPDASGSLVVLDADAAGNRTLELSVRGLPAAPSGRPFELWLTRDGEPATVCGAFATGADGAAASVPMSVPYSFDGPVGWVVVEAGTATPLLTT